MSLFSRSSKVKGHVTVTMTPKKDPKLPFEAHFVARANINITTGQFYKYSEKRKQQRKYFTCIIRSKYA